MGTTSWLAASAILAAGLIGQPARADDLIENYNAYIGQDDLYNSSNERLTQPWQIIRQDRANYHRFGVSQPGDEGDAFFDSARNRDRAERMIRDGVVSQGAARAIAGGDVMVNVQVFRRRGSDYIIVTVF